LALGRGTRKKKGPVMLRNYGEKGREKLVPKGLS